MNDLSWLAPTIAAFGAFVVGVMTIWKSAQIHTLVNSAMTRVKADLALSETRNMEAERRILALEETIVRIQGKATTEHAEPQ